MDTHKISFRKLTASPLARNSAIVFAGTMVSNVLAYAYHLFMGRILGPSGYGELASLLSILYIFTVPLIVTQTVLVKFVSGFKAHGEVGQAKSLFLQVSGVFLLGCVVGIPVALVAAPWITGFLHLSSPSLFILLYVLFAVYLLTTPALSILQGYQKFVWMSVFVSGSVLVKLILSIPMATGGVYGVLLAAVIAAAIIYALYFVPLFPVLRSRGKQTHVTGRDMFGFTVPTLLATLGITSLYSTDIILVRHFFSSSDAGLYAALAVLGKIIFYASSAVSLVLFPVVAERAALKKDAKKLVWSALGGVSIVSFGLTILYFLFPDFIIQLLFGKNYTGGGPMLGIFGVFLALYSIGNIVVTSCLALGRVRIWIIPILAATAQVAGIWIFHGSIFSVIMLNIAVCTVFVLGSITYFMKAR